MRTFRRIVICILILTMVASITSCKTSGQNEENDSIVIGVICPITGESALYGEIMSRTVQMLVDEANSQGGLLGKQIKLNIYDNRDDSVETTNAARKAIVNDKVVALIGTDASTTTIAMASVCEENKIPMITTIASNAKVTQTEAGEVRKYAFRACLSDPQLGEIMGNYAFKKLGYKKCAVLYNVGSDYSVGVYQNFTKNFEAAGGKITIAEAFNNGDVDFRAQLSKIKDAGDFDALYLAVGYYKEDGLIANQARALGLTQPLVGTDSFMANDIFNIAGENVEGTTLMMSVDIDADTLQDFKDDYIAKYGYDPSTNAAADAYLAYDAFAMLKSAILTAKEANPEKIRDALEKTTDLEGLTCKITINPETHNPNREAPIYQIKDQAFVKIDKYKVGS